MFAPMIKWYALYKIMFKIGMPIMLIIICKHVFRIIIIVNYFIFIVLCAPLHRRQTCTAVVNNMLDPLVFLEKTSFASCQNKE